MSDLAVPGYDVIRSIPHNGVARLHLVRNAVLGTRVIKRVDTLGREDSIAYTEPRLLAEIRHDNIVEVFDARIAEDLGYTRVVEIKMRHYPEGTIYDALMREYQFSIRQAVALTRDVLAALTHVHDALRYLHRDVKPANVLLDNGRTKALLADFGSAVALDSVGTAHGSLGRSPLYEPPEAYVGSTDVRSDVYATGLTLFEMLNGRFRYEDLAFDGIMKRLRIGRRQLPDTAYAHQPWVSRALRRVVNKAIARHRASRFPTAAEFRHELMRVPIVDWKRQGGDGLVGMWMGAWTTTRGTLEYRVVGEQSRSDYRVHAARRARRGGRWMTVAREDVSDQSRAAALAAAFDASLHDAAQRLPV